MQKFDEINVGDTVYWVSYSGFVESGKVVAMRAGKLPAQASQICVERSDSLVLIDVKNGLHATERDANFERAQQCQKEAAENLRQAAQAFERAGIAPAANES